MKFAQRVLRHYTQIPSDTRELRLLLDDIGIEVKRIEEGEHGLVFAVELLANRGDHYCYGGVAREIVGRTGGSLTFPEHTKLTVGESPVTVNLESELCLRYSATLLERTGSGDLPHDVVLPILASGGNSLGAAIDATNLSNLELGQPTHVFDADKVKGPITVRLSRAGETAWPLFTEERVEVPEGTLVIADDEKILAVAGVIGCEDSKTTEQSTRIILESATFDPVAVRKAARALDIHTDSKARFERGSDPELPLVGAGRVVYLLEKYAGFKRVGATSLTGAWTNPERVIALEIPSAANFLVHPLTSHEAKDRLERYGFEVSETFPDWQESGWETPAELEDWSRSALRNTVLVKVPPARLWDVEFAADLHEELAKSIGYNNTPSSLPVAKIGALPSEEERIRYATEEVLLGAGFYEVFTDGFHGRQVRELLGLPEGHVLHNHVETQNALDRGYSLLKNNGLAQAVLAVADNVRVRNTSVRCYEWTRTFHPDAEATNGVCREDHILWAIACEPQRSDDWTAPNASFLWTFKRLIEELGHRLRIPLALGAADPAQPLHDVLHPGRQATITLDGQVVGVLGEVHPRVVHEAKLKKLRPVYLQLDEQALFEGSRPEFVEPPQHHPSVRDLAFTLPQGIGAGTIKAHLEQAGPAWLRFVRVTDVYAHEEEGRPMRSVTFQLEYANDGAERSAEEINAASEYLIKAVQQRFGDRGVKLR